MSSHYLNRLPRTFDQYGADQLRGVADVLAPKRPCMAARLRLMANELDPENVECGPALPCDSEPREATDE